MCTLHFSVDILCIKCSKIYAETREQELEKNVLQKNERTFSSSTTFGICIFFANRKVIFLAFTSNQPTDEMNLKQKYSEAKTTIHAEKM